MQQFERRGGEACQRETRPLDSLRAFHYVCVLDESGSMSGAPWEELKAAYAGLLSACQNTADHRAEDAVSVVRFGSAAKIAHLAKPISDPSLRALEWSGCGGTRFGPAVQAAMQCVAAAHESYRPVVVFMSDGCGGSGTAAMRELRKQYSGRGLQVHVVGFGAGVSMPQLQELADAGGGKAQHAIDGAALAATFSSIASQVRPRVFVPLLMSTVERPRLASLAGALADSTDPRAQVQITLSRQERAGGVGVGDDQTLLVTVSNQTHEAIPAGTRIFFHDTPCAARPLAETE